MLSGMWSMVPSVGRQALLDLRANLPVMRYAEPTGQWVQVDTGGTLR